MRELARCQCPVLLPAAPCSTLATQEDLLCDDCRAGCVRHNGLLRLEDGRHVHVRITGFKWTAKGPVRLGG